MEKQKAITDRIAAAIFYGKTEPIEIPDKGKIHIHAEYTKNGYSSIVNFSFTDELKDDILGSKGADRLGNI